MDESEEQDMFVDDMSLDDDISQVCCMLYATILINLIMYIRIVRLNVL